MLTPTFYERYRVLPSPLWWPAFANAFRALMTVVDHEIVVDGSERLPRTPALLCTNSTQRYDFFTFLRALDLGGHRAVNVTKAKNFHSPIMSFVMKRVGVVPLISRGYVLLIDFTQTVGRRPTDEEYRALRRYLDDGTPLPPSVPFALLQARRRDILGHGFDPAATELRTCLQQVYAASLQQTVRLAREAVDAGFHVHIYPEGTVSPRLGIGKNGAVQLARALGIPIVPVGMNGCARAWLGKLPVPAPGRVVVRVGEVLSTAELLRDLPAVHRPFHPDDERTHRAILDRATGTLMDRINGLLDREFQRSDGLLLAASPKGTAAFL